MANSLNYQVTYTPPALVPARPQPDPNAPLFASEDGLVASLSAQDKQNIFEDVPKAVFPRFKP